MFEQLLEPIVLPPKYVEATRYVHKVIDKNKTGDRSHKLEYSFENSIMGIGAEIAAIMGFAADQTHEDQLFDNWISKFGKKRTHKYLGDFDPEPHGTKMVSRSRLRMQSYC